MGTMGTFVGRPDVALTLDPDCACWLDAGPEAEVWGVKVRMAELGDLVGDC
jgi:hypothetical protein